MKVQLRLPNTTVFDVWTHSPTGTESWTWVSVNVTDYFDQMGTYRLIFYLYIDTPSEAKLYSFRWDDAGINTETKGMEYDYVLKAVSDESYDQNIRLDLYDNSNIGRLSNCTIWFYDATTSSVQIEIIDGSISKSTGDWYSLPASGERRIALFSEESSSGSSVLYMRLEGSERELHNLYMHDQSHSRLTILSFLNHVRRAEISRVPRRVRRAQGATVMSSWT